MLVHRSIDQYMYIYKTMVPSINITNQYDNVYLLTLQDNNPTITIDLPVNMISGILLLVVIWWWFVRCWAEFIPPREELGLFKSIGWGWKYCGCCCWWNSWLPVKPCIMACDMLLEFCCDMVYAALLTPFCSNDVSAVV